MGGRKLSFDVLSGINGFIDEEEIIIHRSISDSFQTNINGQDNSSNNKPNKRKRKPKGSKKKKKLIEELLIIENRVDPVFENVSSRVNGYQSFSSNIQTVICEEVRHSPYVELRQRSSRTGSDVIDDSVVTSGEFCTSISSNVKEESRAEVISSAGKQRLEKNGEFVAKLDKEESLDWKRLMTEDSGPGRIWSGRSPRRRTNIPFQFDSNADFSSMKKSPVKYFMGEIYSGNSLHGTTTLGNEKERERVYDTIFRLPWRCELLIDVGFFVCLDSFLSLLTIMPARILMTLWRFLSTRQFQRLSAAELSDFSCFMVLACGITLLQQADISLIYHMIRGQGTIKLYVVYNVLEIFDKLCQNIGGDVLQTVFSSAKGLANSIERFHISAFILFVLAQNILEAEGPWFGSFLSNALLVFICEMIIDIIKHSFIAKFNEIKPIVYSEFLEDLCKQTMNVQPEDGKNNLTFVPLAPACVVSIDLDLVIRVLTPVYAAHLPYGPLLWRLLWIFLLSAMTYVMLVSLKMMVGMGLHKHAAWYISRCQKRKVHSD
ncbi:hypothetical protein IFM89_027188 [Coptis chinensis]|uniref:Protein POLLEN DEFECTIVE IN GUIDANCE 1 n=1 Tax=Coptis chinensis TaxID=261450 RepID=A0A835M6U6_9MAGN|nr:hypothetical protein IFM89_027188 [Coptis chinensis]